MNKKVLNRFHSRYEIDQKTDCWLWRKHPIGDGRGYFHLNGKQELAHRVSYMLFRGPIPKGLHVCHSCDVPCCVNPDHLWLGTDQDNATDSVLKNRRAVGTKNGRSKFTEDQIRVIRESYPEIKGPALARVYGVCEKVIYDILHRRTWRHVK